MLELSQNGTIRARRKVTSLPNLRIKEMAFSERNVFMTNSQGKSNLQGRGDSEGGISYTQENKWKGFAAWDSGQESIYKC